MSDIATRDTITVDQETFVDALILTGSLDKAAKAIGIPLSKARSMARTLTVVRLLKTKRDAVIGGELASLALKTLTDLMGAMQPPAVRLKASITVLTMAGHGAPGAADPADPKAFTVDQLEAFIAKASAELGDRPDRARPIGGGKAG